MTGAVRLSSTLWIRPSIALAEHWDAIKATLNDFGFTNPRVYGSVLHGTDNELSDLDLLVDPGEGATLLDLSGAVMALDESLGILVDIQTPNGLPAKFCDQVLKEARPL